MKCPNCGYENKSSAKYCIKCGHSLQPDHEKAVHLAFLYTANLSAAKAIAASSADENDLRKNCIGWIQEHDSSLFKDDVHSDNSPLLETINDWDNDLINMDYEERICTLMHVQAKMSLNDIASELQISQECVKAELQSAYKKAHKKEEQPTIPLPEVKEEPPKKKRFSAKKMRQGFIIVLIGALVVILGIFFGVRNYANSSYQAGMDALNESDYSKAADAFQKAVRFGYEGDVEKQLGYAYAGNHDLESATASWQTYYDENTDDAQVLADLINSYEKLADDALDDGSNKKAQQWLEKEYKINPNEFVSRRLNAVKKGGMVRDDSDDEYNSYGQPLRLANNRYAVTFSYDENHHLNKITASVGINSLNSIYSDFNFASNFDTYDIECYKPADAPLAFRSVHTEYDEQDSLKQQEYITRAKRYTKTYSDDSTCTDSDGNTITIEADYDYAKGNGTRKEMLGSNTISEIDYSYNKNSTIANQETLSISEDNPDPTIIVSSCTFKTTLADATNIYQQTVYDENGEEIGVRWYIPHNGTVTLYEINE